MRLSDIFQKLHDDIVAMRNRRGDTGLEPQVVNKILSDVRRTPGYQLCAHVKIHGKQMKEIDERNDRHRGMIIFSSSPETVKKGINISDEDEDMQKINEDFLYVDVDMMGFTKAIVNKKVFYYPHKPANNNEVVYGKNLLSKKQEDIVKAMNDGLKHAAEWIMYQNDEREAHLQAQRNQRSEN